MKIITRILVITTILLSGFFTLTGVVHAKILNKDMVDKAVLAAGYSADFCPINFQGNYLNMSTFFQNKESFPCVGGNVEFRFGQVSLYLRQSAVDSPAKAMANVVLFGEDIFRLDSIGFTYYPNPESGGTFTDEMHETIKGLEQIDSTTLHRTHPSLPGGQETLQNSGISTHYSLDGKIDGIIYMLSDKAYKLVSINTEVHDKVLVDYTQEVSTISTDQTKGTSLFDKNITYVLPTGWQMGSVTENYIIVQSPDIKLNEAAEPGVIGGMQIKMSYEADQVNVRQDPLVTYDLIKNGEDTRITDVQEVRVDGFKAKKYHVDGESGHKLDYYIVANGYGWHISFSSISLAEEKKSQVGIDTFMMHLKFRKETSSDNNWRTYEGKTFSFQYPNGWPDLVVNQLSTRQQLIAEGVFEMEAGSYYNSTLGRAMTFQEYRNQVIKQESNGQEIEYSIGGLQGVRVFDNRNNKIKTRIWLGSRLDKTFIYNITFINGGIDLDTANSVIEPILATFKFTN